MKNKKADSYIITPLTFAGCYRIGDSTSSMNFSLKNKPKWIHRKFCNLILGWRWIDSKKED